VFCGHRFEASLHSDGLKYQKIFRSPKLFTTFSRFSTANASELCQECVILLVLDKEKLKKYGIIGFFKYRNLHFFQKIIAAGNKKYEPT
jgi:hypothetical protein